MENKKYFFVKETKCLLMLIGDMLVDPHKGEYDPYYRVIKSNVFKVGSEVVQYELHDTAYRHYTLIELPGYMNPDEINVDTLETLYGR